MDRLEQLRSREEAATFRLFAACAGLVLGVAAVGVAIFSFELLPAMKAGAALSLGLVGGLPFFGLGRRHARRD